MREPAWHDGGMPTPDFVLELRRAVGHARLWLIGASGVVTREGPDGLEVLLVKRRDNGRWSNVAGIVEPGEEPHDTIVREIAEEASVRAEVIRLTWTAVTDPVTYPNGDVSQYLDHCFHCRWLGGDPAPGDDENLDARFFPAGALPVGAPDGLTPWHRAKIDHVLAGVPEVRLGP